MKFDGLLGHVNKIEFIKYLYQRINHEFQRDEYRPSTPFALAYGIKGVYLSDLDEDIMSSPLVVIQSKALAELVAAKQLADYWADKEEYNDEKIELRAKEISKKYLIEDGMSEEDFDFFQNLYGDE